jgi:hypothetical protein
MEPIGHLERFVVDWVETSEMDSLADTKEEPMSQDMEPAYKEWAIQRDAAADICAAMATYVESKFAEYKYLRGCSTEPSTDMARELAEKIAAGAITEALNATWRKDRDHGFTGRWKENAAD